MIYLLLMEFWRWMILVTGDFMKMLFRSFWLTMARVKNVRLKSASFVSSFSFFSHTHVQNYSCVSFFSLLCMCEYSMASLACLLVYLSWDGWMVGMMVVWIESMWIRKHTTHMHKRFFARFFLCIGMQCAQAAAAVLFCNLSNTYYSKRVRSFRK